MHASIYMCVFRENYGAIALCSNWYINFLDTVTYTYHTSFLATPPMGPVIFCAHVLPTYTCPPRGLE